MHCTKITAEFEFGGHRPLGAHPLKCGVELRRWENQHMLSSFGLNASRRVCMAAVPARTHCVVGVKYDARRRQRQREYRLLVWFAVCLSCLVSLILNVHVSAIACVNVIRIDMKTYVTRHHSLCTAEMFRRRDVNRVSQKNLYEKNASQ